MKNKKVFSFGSSKSKCLIIGGHHGDEPIGIEIANKLTTYLSKTPIKKEIIIIPEINVLACNLKTRKFKNIDLNRQYGDEVNYIFQNLINNVKQLALSCELVIDLHSTPSELMGTTNNVVLSKPSSYCRFYKCENWDDEPAENSFREFCYDADVPFVLYEGSDSPDTFNGAIKIGFNGTIKLLKHLGFL